MYRLGAGGPVDYERAFGWLHRAADHGVAAAKYNLGSMFALGQGAPKDLVKAYDWYVAAVADSDPAIRGQAEKSLALLKAEMTPDDIAEAQRLAPH